MDLDQYLDELSKERPETAKMLSWCKQWLESAPLMGDKTKTVLMDFCKEWGVDVKLPK